MLPKSAMLEAIRVLGGQPDPHQTSVRLHSQLRKLEVKDAIAKASETRLDNLSRKHGIATRKSRKAAQLAKFFQLHQNLFCQDFPFSPGGSAALPGVTSASSSLAPDSSSAPDSASDSSQAPDCSSASDSSLDPEYTSASDFRVQGSILC